MIEETLANSCYQAIKEAIITGEFAPGKKLRIIELKARLQVGATPIREALSRLISSGLIGMEANKGFFVKDVSEAEVKDIYATFSKIELLALNESISRGDVLWEASVISALHQLSAIEKSPPLVDCTKWLSLNYQFHYSLVAACGSPCLLKIRESVYQLFDRYCHLSLLANKEALLLNHQEHCELAQAALARDTARVCKLTALHLDKSLGQVLEKLKVTRDEK